MLLIMMASWQQGPLPISAFHHTPCVLRVATSPTNRPSCFIRSHNNINNKHNINIIIKSTVTNRQAQSIRLHQQQQQQQHLTIQGMSSTPVRDKSDTEACNDPDIESFPSMQKNTSFQKNNMLLPFDVPNWIQKQIIEPLQSIPFLLRPPPLQIDDFSLLLYDIFLLLNLTVSISFLVLHRWNMSYVSIAVNEGCLLSVLWLLSGLWTGAFLHSAMDGHVDPYNDTNNNNNANNNNSNNNRKHFIGTGPVAAAWLAFITFLMTTNLRLLLALIAAMTQHRLMGETPMEQLLPLELSFGFCLMAAWRLLHSSVTPRL